MTNKNIRTGVPAKSVELVSDVEFRLVCCSMLFSDPWLYHNYECLR